MNKEQRISQTIKTLQEERTKILEEARVIGQQLEEQHELYRKLYPGFFSSKTAPTFVLYDRFSSFSQIQSYYSKIDCQTHPIYEYGEFDIRELAEVIKLLYSYQRQKEYQIMTFGNVEWMPGRCKLEPNLNFLIGNDRTLEDYQEYQHCFLENDSHFKFEYSDSDIQSFISLMAQENRSYQHFPENTLLPIACFPDDYIRLYCKDSAYSLWYYDELRKVQDSSFRKNINIFADADAVRSSFVHYKGIKDTLSFPIHINDSFIAKALISIAIYKKNNQKTSLSNEDYRYIFRELYGEDVDIQEEIKKDIPKTLKYVP